MLTRMLMTTVAAFVLAAPVAAQDQGKPRPRSSSSRRSRSCQRRAQTGRRPTRRPRRRGPAAGGDRRGRGRHPAPAMTAEERAGRGGTDVAEEEAAPPADMTFIEVQEEAQFLADDEVIGKDVVNIMDEQVGTIADLVMDSDQKLVGVVLSVGGFLGIGEKWVAIPVDQIEFPTDDQPARLTVAVTEEQLTNAPDFVTRDTVEAQEAAEQAQQQMQQQQLQQAPPATTTQ